MVGENCSCCDVNKVEFSYLKIVKQRRENVVVPEQVIFNFSCDVATAVAGSPLGTPSSTVSALTKLLPESFWKRIRPSESDSTSRQTSSLFQKTRHILGELATHFPKARGKVRDTC